MSKQINEEALSVAGEIREQLKFYREIGLEDIGSAGATELGPGADSTSTSRVEPQNADIETTRQSNIDAGQPALFQEAFIPRNSGAQQRSTLPIASDLSLEAIRENLGDCRRCKLHEHRRTIVFGEGNPRAKLVFVGEGPGAEEDATGRPFVGRAGQLLDKIIAAIGLKREDVYIANIVKCRPPGNRTPERDEVETCEPFLFRQIACIKPLVIVALGSPAFQCLLRTREPITRVRGQWRDLNGIRLMPTFHPAFLLRSPDKKREVWEDMKKVRDYLNSK
jgi:DNA polymerase